MKYLETLTAQDRSRYGSRYRLIRPRHEDEPLQGLLTRTGTHRKETKSKRRFRLSSIAPAKKRKKARFAMRVLLRNAKTAKFLGVNEHWTKNPGQARDFRNGWWATIHAFTKDPRHLVIHYEFDDNRYNLSIPILGNAKA